MHWGRSHLIYGEWLRRNNRRADARTELRIAYDMFVQIGADGFAERARRELRATGESVLRQPKGAAAGLTTQESYISRLAREGYTNSEIASCSSVPAPWSGTWARSSPNSASRLDGNCGSWHSNCPDPRVRPASHSTTRLEYVCDA